METDGWLVVKVNVITSNGELMKRHGNLWLKIVDIENLKLAYKKARKGKMWQDKIKEFDQEAEDKLLELHTMLTTGKFTTSPYTVKKIYEPKERDIYVLPFYPDRIASRILGMGDVLSIIDKAEKAFDEEQAIELESKIRF